MTTEEYGLSRAKRTFNGRLDRSMLVKMEGTVTDVEGCAEEVFGGI